MAVFGIHGTLLGGCAAGPGPPLARTSDAPGTDAPRAPGVPPTRRPDALPPCGTQVVGSGPRAAGHSVPATYGAVHGPTGWFSPTQSGYERRGPFRPPPVRTEPPGRIVPAVARFLSAAWFEELQAASAG